MPYEIIIDKFKRNESFCHCKLGENDVKTLAEALKVIQISKLDLSYNNIGCNGLIYLTPVLKYTQINSLILKKNNICDKGLKFLAEALKDTQITRLDLSYNNIGNCGLVVLLKHLKDTQINSLILTNNNIGSESGDYLLELIKDTKINELDLRMNIIRKEDFSKSNYFWFSKKMNHCFYFNEICTEGFDDKIICFDVNIVTWKGSYCQWNNIRLNNLKIGIEAARFINKTFKKRGIAKLELKLRSLDLKIEDAICLSIAFKDIEIANLKISYSQGNKYFIGCQYFWKAFKNSKIVRLTLCHGVAVMVAKFFPIFLKQINVLEVDFSLCKLGRQSIIDLVSSLCDNDVLNIYISRNNLSSEALHLFKLLKNSEIIYLDNICLPIFDPYSFPLIKIDLISTEMSYPCNCIEYELYQDVSDKADNNSIQLSSFTFSLKATVRPTVAETLTDTFKEFVLLDPESDEFEFTLPRKNVSCDISRYAFLIYELNHNKKSKLLIFNMCRKNQGDYVLFEKINKFIRCVDEKFINFFENKLPDIIDSFGIIGEIYVNLVKKFESMKLNNIVEKLLLHRVLFYVDENQEILHPYIYILFHKYNIPLYNEQINPNKKEEIISYYQNNKDIDGAEEIVNLFKSLNFV